MVRPVEALPAKGTLGLVPQLGLHLGGLASVCAATSAKLGLTSAVIGRIGADGFGDFIENYLRDAGVDTSYLARIEGARTSATVALVDEAGERTFLHHVGATQQLCANDVPDSLLASTRLLHWGGPGITPGLEGAPMAEVMRRARQHGAIASMDTCFDGEGIWEAKIRDVLPHLDIVFSALEEGRLYTGQAAPEAIAAWYRERGVGTAVIKLGEQGIYAENGEGAVQLPAHHVEPLDTTGAGDAACGAFFVPWLEGQPLEACVRYANAAGGMTVTAAGGAGAVRSREQLEQFMRETQYA